MSLDNLGHETKDTYHSTEDRRHKGCRDEGVPGEQEFSDLYPSKTVTVWKYFFMGEFGGSSVYVLEWKGWFCFILSSGNIDKNSSKKLVY